MSTRPRPGRILALGALSSFGPLSLDLYLPGLPAIAADLGTSVSATQLSLSACLLGLALGQLLAGPVTDHLGRRRVLVAGVALFAVSAGLCAVAPSIEVLIALRLLSGLGGGTGIVVARSMARDLHSGPELAKVYAQLMLISGMAPVVAPLLGGQVLQWANWRWLFALLAGIGLVLVVIAVSRRETLPVHRRRSTGPGQTVRVFRGLLGDRTFLPPTLVLGFGLCGMFTYLAMASFVLQDVYGLSPQTYAVVSAVNAAAIIAFAQVSALLVPRVGARPLLTAGVVLAAVAAAAMLVGVHVSDSPVALLVPLFVMVGCTGLISPNATAIALDRQGELAGSASALLGAAHFGFAAVVPPLASLNGVSPLVMAVTVLGTTSAALLVRVVAVRAPAVVSTDLVSTSPIGLPQPRQDPPPAFAPRSVESDTRPHPRMRTLEWVPVAQSRPGGGPGWQAVRPTSRPAPRIEPDPPPDRTTARDREIEQELRGQWQRIAEHARRERIRMEEDARTDPPPS